MNSPELDHNVIDKIASICAGEDDVVTLMAVIAAELYELVDEFDCVVLCQATILGTLKLTPYQGGHGCLVIPVFDRDDNLLAVLDIDSDQPGFFTRQHATQLEDLMTRLFFCPGHNMTNFSDDAKVGPPLSNWTAPVSPDKAVW